MRILVGYMPGNAGKLYEYLLNAKAFKLLNEGIEYRDGKSSIDIARFTGPGNYQIEIMVHDSGFETVNIYRATNQGLAIVISDVPAIMEVESFKKVFSSLWGIRK